MSDRKFGIVSDLSGLSQGIVVNSITKNNNSLTAQARDEKGFLIDLAVYNLEKQFTIDGLYVGSGVAVGSVVKIDNDNFLVTSTSRNETNTNFSTASINARYFPDDVTPTPPEPPEPNPSLTFKAINGSAGIGLSQQGSPSAITLQYSKNGGDWTEYDLSENILLSNGDTVAFSGTNDHFSKNGSNYYQFVIVGNLSAYGNIQSLMNFSETVLPSCYYNLFRDCTTLKGAPDLPATGLAAGCYKSMFFGCTSLTTAPALPATTLAQSCYSNMFNGCTGIKAITLPATTLVMDCYNYMLKDCSSLTSIKVSFTSWSETTAIAATNTWVNGVAAEGTFTKPSSLPPSTGINYIPEGWTVNTSD